MPTQRKLAAVVFTDIAGYTKQISHDELKGLDRRRKVEQVVKSSTLSHTGRVVKTIGDGFMLEFNSSVEAVSCALGIQKGMVSLNRELAPAEPVYVRIGIHVGDVVEEDGDLYGNAVNIAQRVQTMATPGGICITRDVYTQIRPILNLQCDSVTIQPEKPMPEQMEVFQIADDGGAVRSARELASGSTWMAKHPRLWFWIGQGLFVAGWIAAWRLLNIGQIGPFAGSLLLASVSAIWVRWWHVENSPEFLQHWTEHPTKSRLIRVIAAMLFFTVAYGRAFYVNLSVWDWLVWSQSSPSLMENFKGQEYQLIRQLNAFKEHIPNVELIRDEASFFYNRSRGELIGHLFLPGVAYFVEIFIAVVSLVAVYRTDVGVRPAALRAARRSGVFGVAIYLYFVTAIGSIVPFSFLYGGKYWHTSSDWVKAVPDRQVRPALLEKGYDYYSEVNTGALISNWRKTGNYTVLAQNKFVIASVPDGAPLGSYQIFRLWRPLQQDRWRMDGICPVIKAPFITVTCLAITNPHEVLITIIPNKVADRRSTDQAEWKEILESLEAAFRD